MSTTEPQPATPKPERRRFQYSLRTLFIVMTAAALLMGLVVWYLPAPIKWPNGSLEFHGLTVTFPGNGKGQFSITSDSLNWRHESLVLYIKDLGGGDFEIRRNNALLGKVKTGDAVRFSEDGQLVIENSGAAPKDQHDALVNPPQSQSPPPTGSTAVPPVE